MMTRARSIRLRASLWKGVGTIAKRAGSDGLLLASNLGVSSHTAVAASNSAVLVFTCEYI